MHWKKKANDMKRKTSAEFLKSIIKAAIMVMALTTDYGLIADEQSLSGYSNSETLFGTVSKLFYAIEPLTLNSFLLIVLLTFFNMHLYPIGALSKRNIRIAKGAAFLSAFFAMIGKLFYVYNDIWLLTRGTVQMLKGLFVFAGLFLLFFGLIKFSIFEYIRYCEKTVRNKSGDYVCALFSMKYAGILTAAFILAAWMPTITAYYPAVFMGDSEDIIYMAYNYPSGIETSVLPLKEGIYITDHHPVIYTGYISLILHAVRALGGGWDFGIFLCSFIQCLLTICILSYSCIYCARYLKREDLALAAVLFYALLPWMPKYAIMISKDTFFADLLLLWAIRLHKAVCTKGTKKDMLALAIIAAGVTLIRKNGIYIMILTLIFAAVLYRNLWKQCLIVASAVVLVNMLYSNLVLPAAGIPEGSIREMLSVPFQQTARYVKYHSDEVTEEEKDAISGVLDYDSLAKGYTGGLSDPVKNTYHKTAEGAELKAYFAAWFQMLWKHPEEYVAAFFHNYYGYFYPVVNDAMKIARTSIGSMANVNRDGYFDFSHRYDRFHAGLRDMLTFYDLVWMRVPILNLFMTSALYVWVVPAAFILKGIRRDFAALPAVFMYLALLLTVLVGPSNAIHYERYVFPVMLGMPFLVILVFSENERSIKCVNY